MRWPLRSMASNSLKTFVPRPLIAVLPVPSEQMMMFLGITLGGLVVSQFPWTSNPGAKQQIPEVTFDPALKTLGDNSRLFGQTCFGVGDLFRLADRAMGEQLHGHGCQIVLLLRRCNLSKDQIDELDGFKIT